MSSSTLPALVYSSTLECLEHEQIEAIALIAEGAPECHAHDFLWKANSKGVLIIGPATVGVIELAASGLVTLEGTLCFPLLCLRFLIHLL